jgi:Na+/H+ antiporter NhaD/arsenite permease-like protein
LGFLQGVPFFWTVGTMLLPMGLSAVLLLSAFYLLDRRAAKLDPLPPRDSHDTGVSIGGLRNLWLLGGIIGAVLLSGFWKPGTVPVLGVDLKIAGLVRDALIVTCGLISLKITARAIRTENSFNWGPMLEVSKLFAAIFVTIVPALAILQAGEQGAMKSLVTAVETPWQFFWATGSLSSFLDNAPTYLAFFSVAIGKFSPGVDYATAVHALTTDHAIYLAAISAGSVFMGANTYIGSAPNFMVKAIAEEGGVKMPSFFGYIFRWTLPFLIPVFLIDTLLFRLM